MAESRESSVESEKPKTYAVDDFGSINKVLKELEARRSGEIPAAPGQKAAAKFVECSDCKGRGEIKRTRSDMSSYFVACARCRGSGKIPL